jgi:hypothetical protein
MDFVSFRRTAACGRAHAHAQVLRFEIMVGPPIDFASGPRSSPKLQQLNWSLPLVVLPPPATAMY